MCVKNVKGVDKMKSFTYFMPVKMFYGKDCVINNSSVFKTMGASAIIVTGKSSAKNGSLDDVKKALEKENISYCIYNDIKENPTGENVLEAVDVALKNNADFVIGIGGGSPMDSAKAVAFLVKNKGKGIDFLFEAGETDHLPIAEIPTTAGTGSETTQYSILTLPEKQTKSSIAKRTFSTYSFLDAKYFESLPVGITRNTAVDALTHLIEAYLCTANTFFSDIYSEKGMEIFEKCKAALIKGEFTEKDRENLLLASTIAGIAISQSPTSLPHAMGYSLTFFKGLAHGPANAQFIKAYMDTVPEKDRVEKILSILGFKDTDELDEFFRIIVPRVSCSDDEVELYTDQMMSNPAKLKTISCELTREDVYNIIRISTK